MSGGMACKCDERKEPIGNPCHSNRPGRLWRVVTYRCNHSAFHGGYQASRYSGLTCLRCGNHWRTKAPYADALPHLADDERNISRGYPGHAAAMEARGRKPLTTG
jgi:hypothetical protein